MIIYIGLLSIFILALFFTSIDKRFRYIFGIILTLSLIFVSGFRYNVGMDYPPYEELYSKVSNGEQIDSEIGFVTICRICSMIGANAQLMFLILAIITISFIYKS